MRIHGRIADLSAAARSAAACLLLAFPAMLLPAGPAGAVQPVERDAWSVGLAWGLGSGSVTYDDLEAPTDWTKGGSPQMRVGRQLNSHLMLGVELRQWLNETGLAEYKVRGNVQNLSLVLTAYPGSAANLTSGFYLQAGGGFSHGRLSGLAPIEGGENEWGETYEVVYKHDAEGWGAVVGAGYEFRLSRHCAAGLAVSYNFLSFDDDVFDEAEFVPASLNLNWYF